MTDLPTIITAHEAHALYVAMAESSLDSTTRRCLKAMFERSGHDPAEAIREANRPLTSNERVCRGCEHEIPWDWVFCAWCGEENDRTKPGQDETRAPLTEAARLAETSSYAEGFEPTNRPLVRRAFQAGWDARARQPGSSEETTVSCPGAMPVQHPMPCWCPYCGEPHSPAVRATKDAEKASAPQCNGLCQGHQSELSTSAWFPDAACPLHGIMATLLQNGPVKCPWCGGDHVGTDCKAEKANAETRV